MIHRIVDGVVRSFRVFYDLRDISLLSWKLNVLNRKYYCSGDHAIAPSQVDEVHHTRCSSIWKLLPEIHLFLKGEEWGEGGVSSSHVISCPNGWKFKLEYSVRHALKRGLSRERTLIRLNIYVWERCESIKGQSKWFFCLLIKQGDRLSKGYCLRALLSARDRLLYEGHSAH